jgi:hypothetical protein
MTHPEHGVCSRPVWRTCDLTRRCTVRTRDGPPLVSQVGAFWSGENFGTGPETREGLPDVAREGLPDVAREGLPDVAREGLPDVALTGIACGRPAG